MTDEPSPPSIVPLWRQEGTVPSPAARRSSARQRALGIVLIISPVLLSAVLWVFSWFRPVPSPYFVPLGPSHYVKPQLAALPFGEQDEAALREGHFFRLTRESGYSSGTLANLRAELRALPNDAQATGSLVVYLIGLARTGSDGQVYLLPADAIDVDTDRPENGLPLSEILTHLSRCQARNQLLVLDIVWPLAQSQRGVLTDDVASAVRKQVERLDDESPGGPRLLVLCSCSPGQVGLFSEDIGPAGRSVFSYYLEEGLRGWAERSRPDGKRKGQVAVSDLARFVRERVDRWSRMNADTRQTPILYGKARDFLLVVLDHGEPQPHLPVAPVRPYPTWLKDFWVLCEKYRQDESYRAGPRVFRLLEGHALGLERGWWLGQEADSARSMSTRVFEAAREQLQLNRTRCQAEPQSLALALAFGQQPDEALEQAVAKLVAGVRTQAPPAVPVSGEAPPAPAGPPDQLLAGVLPAFQGKSAFALAHAVFRQLEASAAREGDPGLHPATIRLLDELLARVQPNPLYAETLFLRRLAGLAAEPGRSRWPHETVRQAVLVTRAAEQAACNARAFPWVGDLLEEAAQTRHEAEILLWSPGYASPTEADRLLRQAAGKYAMILRIEEAIDRAQQGIDEALAFLPSYIPYLELVPTEESNWLAALQVMQEFRSNLQPLGETRVAGSTYSPPSPGLLLEKAEGLRAHLRPLQKPFTHENVERLIKAGEDGGAGSALLLEMKALLATSLLTAADRLALWGAYRDLSRRLHAQTVELDAREGLSFDAKLDEPDYQRKQEQLELGEIDRAARRVRLSLALLRLLRASGIEKADPARLEAGLRAARSSRSPKLWYDLGLELKATWENLARDTDVKPVAGNLRAGMLLSQVLDQPFASFTALDDPRQNPAARLRALESVSLYEWLAGRYRYEAGNPGGATFPATAAHAYHQAALRIRGLYDLSEPKSGPLRSGLVGEVIEPAVFAGTATVGTSTVRFRAEDASSALDRPWLDVRVVADEDWLRITPERQRIQLTVPLRFRVELKRGADREGKVPPLGFLVEARIEGRSYALRVPIALDPLATGERFGVFFSTAGDLGPPGPDEPKAGPGPRNPPLQQENLRLRTVPGRQPWYLYVRNPTPRPRSVVVELQAPGSPLPWQSLPVSLPPLGVGRAGFAGAGVAPVAPVVPVAPVANEPAAVAALPELTGPIQVRVRAADGKKEYLEEREVRVTVAAPEEYVRVSSIRFTPARIVAAPGPREEARKNRLAVTLKGLAPTLAPPVAVRLVVRDDEVPGLLAPASGLLRGELRGDGELQLFAEDLRFREGGDDEGLVFLEIDGQERAFRFRTTFARGGEPLTPRAVTGPGLRLNASRTTAAGPGYQVAVEVDDPPAGSTLELSLGRVVDGRLQPGLVQRHPPRVRRLGFSPTGPGGALLFEASQGDWKTVVDTSPFRGPMNLRVRLLDEDGGVILTASQEVIVDDRPPDRLAWVGVPKTANRKAPLKLEVRALPGLSGISQVVIFLGKPTADGKLPDTQRVAARAVDVGKTRWVAELPLEKAGKGPTEISVQAVSGAGMRALATTTVEVVDSDPVLPGRVEGRVLEGARPQPDLEVVLEDAKGAQKGKTKTSPEGTFVFSGLPAGDYRALSSKPVTGRKGEQKATVRAGETTTVTIELAIPPRPPVNGGAGPGRPPPAAPATP